MCSLGTLCILLLRNIVVLNNVRKLMWVKYKAVENKSMVRRRWFSCFFNVSKLILLNKAAGTMRSLGTLNMYSHVG